VSASPARPAAEWNAPAESTSAARVTAACAPSARLGMSVFTAERSGKSSVLEDCVRSTPKAGRNRPARASSDGAR
jgi:hypothetical protein